MVTSTDEQRASTADAFHALRIIRFLSLALIALGLLFWLYLTVFIFSYYGGKLRSLSELVFLLLPYVYLFSFFLSCLKIIRGRALVALCTIFNLPLIVFIGYALSKLSPVGIALALFPLLWILLCVERLKIERQGPSADSFSSNVD